MGKEGLVVFIKITHIVIFVKIVAKLRCPENKGRALGNAFETE